MDDSIVVADPDGRIVDCNPAARRALDEGALGGTLRETAIGTDDGVAEGGVEIDVGEESRTYEVSTTALYDFRGDVVGRFVLLRDVTELQVLRDHEQRLSVLNRLLRHNLRNEVNVIAGANELLAASVDGEDVARIRTIEAAAERMLGIGEKARYLETTAGSGPSARVPVDVVAAVAEVAERTRTRPSASTPPTPPGRPQWATGSWSSPWRTWARTPWSTTRPGRRPSRSASTAGRRRSPCPSRTTGRASPRPSGRRSRRTGRRRWPTRAAWASGWSAGSSTPPTASWSSRRSPGSVVTVTLERVEPPARGDDDRSTGFD